MDRSDSLKQPDDRTGQTRKPKTPYSEGISPLNPDTFPRAEDDEETFAHSPEFHDVPDPGPDQGKPKREWE